MPLHHFDRILREEYFSYKYAARVMVIFLVAFDSSRPFSTGSCFQYDMGRRYVVLKFHVRLESNVSSNVSLKNVSKDISTSKLPRILETSWWSLVNYSLQMLALST